MQCEVAAAARSGCASGGVALSGRHRHVRGNVSGRHVAAYKDYLLILPKNQVRVYNVPRATTALPHSTRKMRQADDDDEGIEMGGTLDPEDGLQGIASKARPMPKW